MNKKVLILGGSSDIGTELVKIFLENKYLNISIHYHTNLKKIKVFKNNI